MQMRLTWESPFGMRICRSVSKSTLIILGVLGTGCDNSQTTKNHSLVDAYGVKLSYPQITTTSNGTTITINIPPITVVHPLGTPIRYRVSFWDDANGNGIIDAGEIEVQEVTVPPPGGPAPPGPPPGGPAPGIPPAQITRPVPPGGGPIDVDVRVDIEFVDEAGVTRQATDIKKKIRVRY